VVRDVKEKSAKIIGKSLNCIFCLIYLFELHMIKDEIHDFAHFYLSSRPSSTVKDCGFFISHLITVPLPLITAL